MTTDEVALIGAGGFVGSAIASALEARDVNVRRVRAPRLPATTTQAERAETERALADTLANCQAVINSAGVADASAQDASELFGANAVLPGLVAKVSGDLGTRFVHVSSGAVQGAREMLDSTDDRRPFSPYSQSKSEGELAVLSFGDRVTVYRPPGVHGPDRRLTRSVVRLAQSPVASVAGDGQRPTAQALVSNVGDAVAHLATTRTEPPSVVHQPSEGLSTASLLRYLGGREPVRVPTGAAKAGVRALTAAARARPALMPQVRRLEMLWLGQGQAPSWLEQDGWSPVDGHDSWERLGQLLRAQVR